MYARLGWIDQPMKMRETSRGKHKKAYDNNKWMIKWEFTPAYKLL